MLTVITAQAQWWGSTDRIRGNSNVVTETRNVGSFDQVGVGGSFDVILEAGKEGEITVRAESNLMEYIITETRGTKLIIKIKDNTNFKTNDKIIVTVPFEDIDAVSLGGSGDVVSRSVIRADRFKASLAGSGDMNLEVQATTVKSSLAGSGDLNLRGTTQDIEISMAGSGDIDASDLKARNAEVSMSGSGDIKLTCDGGELKARISGSGDIRYKGTPSREDIKVAGSGSVKSM